MALSSSEHAPRPLYWKMTFLSGLKKVQADDGAHRVGSAVAVKLSVAPIPSVGSLRLDCLYRFARTG
jgi:hypothetical protein